MAIIAQDTFSRANQSGWGTGSDGKTWSEVAGTDPLSISSNKGLVTKASGTSNRMLYGSGTATACEALVRITIGDMVTVQGLLLCSDSTNANGYSARFSSSGTTIEMAKRVSSSITVLSSPAFTIASGSAYWLRFRVESGTLYARAWLDGNSEPSTWTGTVADSTFSSGQYGIASFPNSAAAEKFDSFSVNDTLTSRDIAGRLLLKLAGKAVDLASRLKLLSVKAPADIVVLLRQLVIKICRCSGASAPACECHQECDCPAVPGEIS